MSLFFIINNLVFAFGMVGAIVCIMAAWLSFDAYRLRPDPYVFSRAAGFSLVAVTYLIQALTLGNDILSFAGAIIFGIGLLCIIASFLKKSDLVVHAIIVIPSFSLFSRYIHGVATIALLLIAYFAYRQWKHEQNRTWIPFMACFALVGVGSFLAIFVPEGNQTSLLFIARMLFEVAGFVILGYWVWQYMRLRINESIMMISVGVTFILATIVTLAFSTILISRVTAETSRNLVTDVKVLDLSVNSLKGESLAKASLIARERDIIDALSKNDIPALDQASAKFLQTYGLGFLTVADPQGSVIVRAHALSRHGDSVSGERSFEEASKGDPYATVEDDAVEGLSIRAGAPIYSSGDSTNRAGGKIIGVIIAGYPLDNAFADGMKRVTGLEMFVYKGDTSISGTALAADGTKRLVGVKISDSAIKTGVLQDGHTVTANVDMFGEPFQASYAPIENSDGKIVGMLSAAKHQQDIINIANATNRLTLITVILILLLLLAPIYALAKRLSADAAV
jgi:hypothetical protein